MNATIESDIFVARPTKASAFGRGVFPYFIYIVDVKLGT